MNFKQFSASDNQWHDVPYYIHKTDTDTITTLPADIYTDGNNATVGISGNMSQAGAPTPTSPIQPQETGDRTGNLIAGMFAGSIGTTGGIAYSDQYVMYYVPVTAGETYTISGSYYVYAYYADKPTVGITSAVDNKRHFTSQGNTITVISGASWIGIRAPSGDIPMVNLGSTALPYENFGYKIPISSGGENLCPDTGWRSGQYRDGVWETTNTRSTSDFFPVSSNRYRLKINAGQLISFINFNYFDNQKQWLGNRTTLGMSTFSPTAQNIVIPQLPSNAAYMSITIRFYNDNGNPPIPQSFIDDSNIMVSEGTSEPSYEPYNRTTTPIYLGEVPTTRKIGKLVLDGTENWVLEYTDNFLLNTAIDNAEPNKLVVCTHQQSITTVYEPDTNFENVRISQTKKLNFRTRTIPHNLSDFKAYLQQQYAAGTPVTVWYVLATETTGIVNEPLRKIGEYADTLSMEQAGVQIPTNRGNTVIDVETELKPSEIEIEYTGWHDASVHEKSRNLFDEDYTNISGTIQYRPIYVGSGNFTLSTTIPYDLSVANIFLLNGDVTSGASTLGNGAWLNHNVTAQSVDGYVTIAYRHYSGTTSPVDCQTMLNTGSTALPYEPYWK